MVRIKWWKKHVYYVLICMYMKNWSCNYIPHYIENGWLLFKMHGMKQQNIGWTCNKTTSYCKATIAYLRPPGIKHWMNTDKGINVLRRNEWRQYELDRGTQGELHLKGPRWNMESYHQVKKHFSSCKILKRMEKLGLSRHMKAVATTYTNKQDDGWRQKKPVLCSKVSIQCVGFCTLEWWYRLSKGGLWASTSSQQLLLIFPILIINRATIVFNLISMFGHSSIMCRDFQCG